MRVIVVDIVLESFGVFERLRALERFWVILRERREDFLSPKSEFELSVLEFLVERWRDLRQRYDGVDGL